MSNPYDRYKGHTEGPFKCNSRGIIHTDDSPLERSGICQMMGHPDAKETQANIALHVAAPTLLDDCRDMWELLEKVRNAMLKKGSHMGWQRAIKTLQDEIEARHKEG